MRNRDIAKHFLSLNLNPVPVKVNKQPARKNHSSVRMTNEEIDQYDFTHIGISTGIISQGLEALDFDLKNSEDPKETMKMFKGRVKDETLKKLVVQTTPSGGYHFVYRCETVQSSRKLCLNSEGYAIIETRGEGGYIKCAPSDGYRLIRGSFDEVQIITPEERLELFIAARMMSETIEKEAKKRQSKEDETYFARFPEYNGDQDIGLEMLFKHGWTYHSEDETWINLTRPDKDTDDGISGGYHLDGKFLFVFSTSQDIFETKKPYNNHAIYAELECNGNYEMAYAKLYEQGYGNESEQTEDEKLNSLAFLSDAVEENTYLDQSRKGEIEQGKSTGWLAMDEYFRFKKNSFELGLGYDNVGKSVFMTTMAVASHVMHGDTWGFMMPENKTAVTRERLIEIQYGRPIESYKNEPELFKERLEENRKHFHIIANKKHYTIAEVLKMAQKLHELKGINHFIIDPYNFFKVSGNGYSHNNDILSQIRVFVEKFCTVWVMAHPSSDAPRNNRDNDGYLTAPSKYSIQGGADFPYRVDNFFVIHRIVNADDPEIRRTMQFISEKIKETKTGGRVHNKGESTNLVWEVKNGFLGYWDEFGNNPMYEALKLKGEIKEQRNEKVNQEDLRFDYSKFRPASAKEAF